MEGFIVLGIIVIVMGFVVMGIHPYQRGGIGGRGGRASGRASGPIWFLLFIVGIALVAAGVYLPG